MEILVATRRVLMVEDSAIMAKIVETFINRAFREINPEIIFVIDVAKKEQEAADLIAGDSYCLVTLDGNLEDGHGINVLKEISPGELKKIIVISTDEFFLKHCRENRIPAFDKNDLGEEEDKLVEAMKGIIKQYG